MTSDLLLVVYLLAAVGAFSLRWTLTLAPAASELPVKTALAVLALLALAFGVLPERAALPVVLVSGLLILAPLALPTLARLAGNGPALALSRLLYWSAPGRAAPRRLLAQGALREGEAEQALALAGDDTLVQAQAYALLERWHELLSLPEPPGSGDKLALTRGARVWALAELGELAAAESELEHLRQLWQASGQGPVGYRSLTLAEARLLAARGELAAAHALLTDKPLPGVPPYLVMMILGRAAERARQGEQAATLYRQAYALAPEPQRPRVARRLALLGHTAPEVEEAPRRTGVATLTLALALLAAYGVQTWLERAFGPDVAHAAAAFLLNIPQIPESDAPWRFLSTAFVHASLGSSFSLLHVGFNVWVLFDLGRLYETRRHGGSLVAAFVFGTVAGAYLSSVMQASSALVLVGASGGVLGVAGALLADTVNSKNPHDRLLTRSLLQWVAIIMLLSVAIPQVSLWGHAGGLLGGLLWGFARQGLGPVQAKLIDRVAGTLSLVAILWALAGATQWLLRYT